MDRWAASWRASWGASCGVYRSALKLIGGGSTMYSIWPGAFEPPHDRGASAAGSAHSAESAIPSTQAYYAARGLPMLWWIGPNTQPDDLADRLMSAGFTPADDLPMMAIDLQSMRMEPTPPNVTIKQVEREDELRAWSRILTEAFSLAGTAPYSFEELEHSLGLESEGRRYRFIAYLHDQPVATSALFADVGVAGIYSVATLPEARRQGIGAAITRAPLLHARALGYRIGTLQATAMGQPVYHRLGFEDIAPFKIYAWSSDQA
jgi:GNAT superfamily N-acetyltransferase